MTFMKRFNVSTFLGIVLREKGSNNQCKVSSCVQQLLLIISTYAGEDYFGFSFFFLFWRFCSISILCAASSWHNILACWRKISFFLPFWQIWFYKIVLQIVYITMQIWALFLFAYSYRAHQTFLHKFATKISCMTCTWCVRFPS